MDATVQELRQAVRALRHDPGFALTALLTIALGVGVPTAMFGVVNAVVLRPLPFPEAGRLVRIWSAHPQRGLPFFSVSAPDLLDWSKQARSFEALGAFERPLPLAWTGADQPEQLLVSRVTPQVFDVLGVAARTGRAFEGSDGPSVVVLGHALWQRRFGGDPAVLGRSLTLDGQVYTVTGVMPPRFALPGSAAEAWIPLDLPAGEDRSRRTLRVLARVREGTSLDAARAELEAVASALQARHPASNAGWSVSVRTLQDVIVGPELRQALLMLLGVVGFVLLIASANVANLVIVRGSQRQRELAVRAALGAGRARLLAQVLAESALLATVGGAAGLLLAAALLEGLRAAAPAALPRIEDVGIDARVLAFAVLASLAASALFALPGAIQASRGNALAASLHAGRRVIGSGAGRLRGALVGLEVALAVVVSMGSLLLVRSLLRLQAVDTGFAGAGVTVVPLLPGEREHPEGEAVVAFYEAVLERVAALPGVEQASLVSMAPFSGPNSANLVAPEGQALERSEAPDADFRSVAPGYFRALRIPLLRGRDFGREDRAGAPPVAIVNRALAQRLWPDQDPVGRRFRVGDVASGPLVSVVGLAGDARYGDMEAETARAMFYRPHAASGDRAMTLVVRAEHAAAPLAASLRQAIHGVDKLVPVPSVRRLDDIVSEALADRRFNASVFGLFAALALALSAVGVYGVMAHFVTQRRQEIAVRVALGARPGAVAAFVLRRGGAAAAAGMAAGVAGALLLGPLLQGLLYRVGPADPPTLALVSGLFAALIAGAAWGPARRAMRVDPAVVLREG
jgi:predicted permease